MSNPPAPSPHPGPVAPNPAPPAPQPDQKAAYAQPGKELTLIPGIEAHTGDAVRTCFGRAAGLAGTRPDAQQWARALSGRASIPLTPPVPRPAPPALPVAPADRRGERDVIVMRPLARPPRSP